jgi:hypothetical protein
VLDLMESSPGVDRKIFVENQNNILRRFSPGPNPPSSLMLLGLCRRMEAVDPIKVRSLLDDVLVSHRI